MLKAATTREKILVLVVQNERSKETKRKFLVTKNPRKALLMNTHQQQPQPRTQSTVLRQPSTQES